MAARGGTPQRPNGIPREKVCQFKLVLLGEAEGGKGGRERRGGGRGREDEGVWVRLGREREGLRRGSL